ncbi:acyltransferase [Yinghuangia seranimata]|uniref:acyltransferase n=1 Tax=Yinghuangia seranimata TaxID=408067 RepID=UPI00248AD173|nr:acyltransferase [Yinghuangia seranimata]MDI2132260.1 acyltransferase [Yinghuangia seranimata]
MGNVDPSGARIMPSADVDDRAKLGDGTVVWHLAQVREGAVLGSGCIVGRGAYVGPDVVLGDNVKLQNYALVYEPARLEDGVFVGPAAVLTNDMYPRSVDPEGTLKRGGDWEAQGVTVREGAAVGARAVIVAGVTVGRWALIAAGAVVTRDVPDFALVAGVPARRVKWVGKAGVPLVADLSEGAAEDTGTDSGERGGGDRNPAVSRWVCPETGARYIESDETLSEVFP